MPSAHHDFLFAVMRSSFDTLVSVDASNRRHRHCSTKREGPACPDSCVVVGTRSHLQVQPRANRATHTACHRVGSSAMQHSCDDAITCSIRLSVTVRSQLNLQMRPRCLQQQTSQGKRDLLVLCYSVCVIDCCHLQKQACQKMNASLRTENHGEQMTPLNTPQIFTTPS